MLKYKVFYKKFIKTFYEKFVKEFYKEFVRVPNAMRLDLDDKNQLKLKYRINPKTTDFTV